MTFGFFVVGKYWQIHTYCVNIMSSLIAIVSIGGQVDLSGLFCRDDDVITTFVERPTLYCILNGEKLKH